MHADEVCFDTGVDWVDAGIRLVDARAEIAAVNEAMIRARRLPYISHSCACGFCDCE